MSPHIFVAKQPWLPNEIDTDACEHQERLALFKWQDSDRRPIGFWPGTLTAHDKSYHMTKKECLAIVYSIRACRHYWMEEKFTELTDHNTLLWVMQISTPQADRCDGGLGSPSITSRLNIRKAKKLVRDFASLTHTGAPIEPDHEYNESPCFCLKESSEFRQLPVVCMWSRAHVEYLWHEINVGRLCLS